MPENGIAYSMDRSVPGFKGEVAREPGGEGILCCYSCGSCTSGCPVREVTDKYNPRRIIHMVLLGMRQQVLDNDFIWLCAMCHTCQERCPQGVRITDIMVALRNIAAREGHYPQPYKMQKDMILQKGRIYEIDEFDNKKRVKSGLPAIIMTADEIRQLYRSLKEEPA